MASGCIRLYYSFQACMYPEVVVFAVYAPDCSTCYSIPLYLVYVSAGFPSPAEDYIEGKLDLNKHLIQHPAATFFVRVTGDSMINAGIHPNDLLVVDRALEPRPGRIVIAVVNGELTVKRIHREKRQLYLMPENPEYEPLPITEGTDFQVWGVVTNVIHKVLP
jgi:DNA polymerase V